MPSTPHRPPCVSDSACDSKPGTWTSGTTRASGPPNWSTRFWLTNGTAGEGPPHDRPVQARHTSARVKARGYARPLRIRFQ
jgi:hypothetical protein